MRWPIIRVLAAKDARRLLKNRGALVLAALLVVFALLLALFEQAGGPAAPLGSLQRCYIDYWDDGPWIDHLKASVPPELQRLFVFRGADRLKEVEGRIVYPRNTGAIQIRVQTSKNNDPRYLIWLWHPGGDPGVMAPFETWFFRESRRYFQTHLEKALADVPAEARPAVPTMSTGDSALLWQELHQVFREQTAVALSRLDPSVRAGVVIPELECTRSELGGGFEIRKAVAAALILFSLFFSCVFLLPSLTCEERERGLLLAQAISPASPTEIVAGKLAVYPALGVALGGILAGICTPAALGRPFFWLSLVTAATATVGLGLSVASLAQTQRAAGMGAMCYTLVVSIIIFVCQQYQIPAVPLLLTEYHVPRMFQASIDGDVQWMHWIHLLETGLLAVIWNSLALILFKRCGWQ